MSNTQESPISLLLQTLGMSREELSKRSDQMRQFLTADSVTSRVFDVSNAASGPSAASEGRAGSLARSLSRARSGSLLDASTPPRTPVKSEPSEGSLSTRPLDTMEAVIERQRLARKEKRLRKERQRELAQRSALPHPPSPTPSSASRSRMSLDSMLSSRDHARAEANARPLTPQQSRYYREHTAASVPALHQRKAATPADTKPAAPQQRSATASSRSHYLPLALKKPEAAPVTPQLRQRVFSPPRGRGSPASPMSSPARDIVNLVSSPGPLGPAPEEDEYDSLPYRLPPGPYSPTKPDCSYAALLGQAILSSPEHRLTLQEIYDWITIVYPYFKRGETTWMNSIRHVLSTTVCFRKVTRDRSQGRTLWAIWDEDLECFKEGGFRKQFCKDMNVKGKDRDNKRARAPAEGDSGRKAKRARKDSLPKQQHQPAASSSNPHPAFPAAIPTSSHHQSYYEACAIQHAPAPVPSYVPRPTTASGSGTSSLPLSSAVSPEDELRYPVADDESPELKAPPPSSASVSSASMPELTPNRSSSSPPPSLASGDVFEDVSQADSRRGSLPVWDHDLSQRKKGKRRKLPFGFDDEDEDFKGLDVDEILHEPPSPSPSVSHGRRADMSSPLNRLGTPPPILAFGSDAGSKLPPCTPPRRRTSSGLALISPERTPLSHKGLHMSPSASLAHYKNHLDPPPRLGGGGNLFGAEDGGGSSEHPSTPSRKRTHTGAFGDPITPRRLFGTPGSGSHLGGSMMSPFRVGLSMGMYGDPHDPLTLLDDDLNRMGTSPSAGGLFGKKRSMMLYDSPGTGKWW